MGGRGRIRLPKDHDGPDHIKPISRKVQFDDAEMPNSQNCLFISRYD